MAERRVRSIDERVAEVDAKIAKKREEIAALEEQKYKLLHPVNMKTVIQKIKEAGITPEEIAEKLGLDM